MTEKKGRVYVVTDDADAVEVLARATSQSGAIARATRARYRARVASQDDIIRLLPDGILEDADPEDDGDYSGVEA